MKLRWKSLKRNAQRAADASRPFLFRSGRALRTAGRRMLRRPRTVSESPNLLPLLIQVLAAFSKVDGDLIEDEVDSILGFLRYDYPDAVYSDLRGHFRQALHEQHDLNSMAVRLSNILPTDRKILLCVQLYDLISKAGLQQTQVHAYHSFMSRLGMAAQAIDIVYQLSASTESLAAIESSGTSPLEFLVFGQASPPADVSLAAIPKGESIRLYRYHDLVLVKNLTRSRIYVRGRSVSPDGFCRIYPGQRMILSDQVMSFEDLTFYFNAKKNVSTPKVYLSIGHNNEISLERTPGRNSLLEMEFGLSVDVTVLKDVEGTLNGSPLAEGTRHRAKIHDRLLFDDRTELVLADVRRRVRAMGGRFTLSTSKSEYLVSNNPSLLGKDDILLAPGSSGDILLKISCDYEQRTGLLEVLQANRPILLRDTPVRNVATLQDGDLIRIDATQMLHCDFDERIIEERRNIIRSLDVDDVRLTFPNGETGLDGITFNAARGEMICVLGSSGSGKSTLMKMLAGQLVPDVGRIELNNLQLYENLEVLKPYLSYVPQDNAFDEQLTIEENMKFAAALRAPHMTRQERQRRVDSKLIELGLNERRDSIVGSSVRKTLSGGERKRLNIGMDMIGNADVYLFDEPTSGLSSKDSEHVLEIIRGIAHNKIVMVVIHQPSAKLFSMFQKALLLDRGGRMVYYGKPDEMLEYFAEANHEHHRDGAGVDEPVSKDDTRPEIIFDVLETPLRDLSGEIIYEGNQKGQLVPARRFSPDYWRDRFESHKLLKDVTYTPMRQGLLQEPIPVPRPGSARFRVRDEWVQFQSLLSRVFLSKMRNRSNLLTTLVEAPVLALLIGIVLRYSESGSYDFASAFHIPTYLFLGLVVSMFLGLTNSADDVIRDRPVLLRERNLNVRMSYYVTAKTLTLCLFAVLQCILFVAIANALLGVRGMFWIYVLWMSLTAFSGIAIGLLISAVVHDAKTAVNIVPLILIPQMLLGGALIKYEEMNRNLDFIHTVNRWLVSQEESTSIVPGSDLEVPLISQFMPVRWSYEALVLAQAKKNPLTLRQEIVQQRVIQLVALAEANPESDAIADELDDTKELLAMLAGLSAASPGGVDGVLGKVDAFLRKPTIPIETLQADGSLVTAEQLYVNQKIADLVSSAEIEQLDYRGGPALNIFFGPVKHYFGRTWSLSTVNLVVLGAMTVFILLSVYLLLKNQLRVRTRRRQAYWR